MDLILRRARAGFIVAFVFSMCLNLLMLVSPIYMLQVYDRVLTSGSTDTLLFLSLIALFALMVLGALDALRAAVLVRTGAWIGRAVGGGLIERMVRASLGPKPIGTLPLRDLSQIQNFISNALATFFDTPWVPFFVLLVWLLHPWLGMLALGSAIILFLTAWLNDRLTRPAYEMAGVEQARAISKVEVALRNSEAIQAMGMLTAVTKLWRDRDRRAMTHQVQGTQIGGMLLGFSKFFRLAAQVGVLGLGALLVLRGEITAGAMIAASILLGRALAPVEQSIGAWRAFANARLSYRRLVKLTKSIPLMSDQMSLPAPSGRLAAEGVVLTSPKPDMPPILNDVNFDLESGEVLGIIGASASGKSSLCRLIVGVWQPTRGHVRLDGAEISKCNKADIGRYIGYLPQDVELFDGTVGQNIARMEEGSPEAIVEAAKRADVHEMILRLPDGYDTEIGIHGTAISGGQRQRIALARAIYGNPKLIVLDEPNANLDQKGEAALVETIDRLKKLGATIVLVAHRLPAFAQVTKLLLLENGRAVDFGLRDDVVKRTRRQQTSMADNKGDGLKIMGLSGKFTYGGNT